MLTLKNLKVSDWENASPNIGKILGIQYANNKFFAFSDDDSRTCNLYSSNNLSTWNLITKLDFSTYGSSKDYRVFFENGTYIITYGNGLYYSDFNLNNFKFIDLSRLNSEFRTCLYCFYKNSEWYIVGDAHGSYSYIKKGFFSDSTKECGIDVLTLFKGQSLDHLDPYSTKDSFPRGSIGSQNIIVLDNNIYAILRDHDKYSSRSSIDFITFSNDRFIKLFSFDEYIEYLRTLNGRIYTVAFNDSKSKIRSIVVNSSSLLQVGEKKNLDIGYAKSFDSYGIALNSKYDERKIYITDNYNDWQYVETPITMGSDNFSFGGNKILIWPGKYSNDNNNTIYYCYLTN